MSELIVVVDGSVIQKLKEKKKEIKKLTASGVVAWALDKLLQDN